MNVQRIRKHLATGFVPFILQTSDGTEYLIPHRGFVAAGKHEVAVINHEGNVSILDPEDIVSFKIIKQASKKASKP